jgi:hypothetical protein
VGLAVGARYAVGSSGHSARIPSALRDAGMRRRASFPVQTVSRRTGSE